MKPYQVVPPSVVIKVNTSVDEAVEVIAGADPPAHSTEAGHVTVLYPVPSWFWISVNAPALPEAGGLLKV